jgi:hypothetical protein
VPQLEFEFDEFLREIRAIRRVTNNFLDRSADNVLNSLERDLEAIRSFPRGTDRLWKIPECTPLKTKTSQGEYEQGSRKGRHRVVGEITSTWLIAPSDPRAKSTRPARTFTVTGKASVRIRLLDQAGAPEDQPLAMWRVELGDDISPGCFFHVQILGEDGRMTSPFPHSLPVPRLPSFLFTPMAALEFVIAELFQEEWKKHAARQTDAMNSWRLIQRERLNRLFEWKQKVVKEHNGSPWTIIKWEKPPADLFLKR